MKTLLALLTLSPTILLAQSEGTGKLDFSLSADFVSSYVWRGMYQTGTSIQPDIGLGIGSFSLSAWGSVDISSKGYKEVDLIATYSWDGFQFAITDYWAVEENTHNYFNYKNHETDHSFEATVCYSLPFEKLPVSLSWNTMFAGADYSKADGTRAYSSYVELMYPFKIKGISLEASVGATPWEGFYADDFAVVNIALKAEKTIKISDSFSFSLFGQLIANPKNEDVFFVAGISF